MDILAKWHISKGICINNTCKNIKTEVEREIYVELFHLHLVCKLQYYPDNESFLSLPFPLFQFLMEKSYFYMLEYGGWVYILGFIKEWFINLKMYYLYYYKVQSSWWWGDHCFSFNSPISKCIKGNDKIFMALGYRDQLIPFSEFWLFLVLEFIYSIGNAYLLYMLWCLPVWSCTGN